MGLPALLLAASAAAAAPAGSLKLSECTLPDFPEPARCGTLSVPENPHRPDGRRFAIAVAVIPAKGDALPDPVVPLGGGPGEDTISEAVYWDQRLAALRERRDILLMDQRGTGSSQRLSCDLHDPSAPAKNLADFFPPAGVRACAAELGRRTDLTQYTYLHFSRDLEAVRRALGYGPLNLFGGSYGTRAAMVFVRAYPGSVRTNFLGSVVPIDEITPLTMARASQEMFEKTFDACAADVACQRAFPNLRREFGEVLKRLESGEIRVPVAGAPDGAPLSRGRVVEWMRARLYRPGTAAELPWLIHQAHSGNWTPIVEGILSQAAGFDTVYGAGLFFSITCAEDLAFLREEDVAAASEGTYLGDYRLRQQQAACESWPKAELPAGYRETIRSPVPTMFVSGDLDAAGPLWLTEQAAKGFSNRVELVSRGQGHTEWNDCLGRQYAQFVESGKTRAIDPDACPAIPRPPFKTP
jgi:pimeloyl-ACP methyl ester carboxylesterase